LKYDIVERTRQTVIKGLFIELNLRCDGSAY